MVPKDEQTLPVDGGIEPDEPIAGSSIAGIAFALFLLLIGGWFLIQSIQIHSNASIWPRALASLLILLSAIRTVTALIDRHRIAAARVAKPNPAEAWWRSQLTTRRLFTAGWLVTYCISALFFGFGWPMLVFVPVYMWFAGFKRPIWILCITLLVAVCLTLLFDTVVGVRLWEFKP